MKSLLRPCLGNRAEMENSETAKATRENEKKNKTRAPHTHTHTSFAESEHERGRGDGEKNRSKRTAVNGYAVQNCALPLRLIRLCVSSRRTAHDRRSASGRVCASLSTAPCIAPTNLESHPCLPCRRPGRAFRASYSRCSSYVRHPRGFS